MTPIKRNLLYIFRGTLLRLRITWDHGKSLTVSVGYHVDRIDSKGKAKWDGERCLRNTTHGEDKVPAAIINKVLDQLETKVDNAFYEYEATDKIPTPDQLRDALNPKSVKSVDLKTLTKLFISEKSALNQWRSRTERVTKQALNILIQTFGDNAKLEDIKEDGLIKIIEYMTNKECYDIKKETKEAIKHRGYDNATINRYIAIIKSFVKWTIETKRVQSCGLLSKTKNLKTAKKPIIYLTMEELNRFSSIKVSGSKKETMECFLFSCFTGLRFSDMSQLKWSNIKSDHIEIVTQKTNDRLTIQLNKFSRKILSDRQRLNDNENVFHPVSLICYNENLKDIAKEAQINDPIEIVSFSGNERRTTILPKWNFITSHTPRKTFVTNALSMGIPTTIVMKWTGHKTLKSMEPYMEIISKAKQESMDLFNNLDEFLYSSK